MFFRAWHRLHFFPANGTGFLFSRAGHQLPVFPRFAPTYMFTRAWYRLHVFPRLAPIFGAKSPQEGYRTAGRSVFTVCNSNWTEWSTILLLIACFGLSADCQDIISLDMDGHQKKSAIYITLRLCFTNLVSLISLDYCFCCEQGERSSFKASVSLVICPVL